MIKLLTAENQINKNIFILIKKFFNILEEKEWEKKYLFWELELLKLSGFELNLEKIVQKKTLLEQKVKDGRQEEEVERRTMKKEE